MRGFYVEPNISLAEVISNTDSLEKIMAESNYVIWNGEIDLIGGNVSMNFYYQKMQMHKNYWRSFYYFLLFALKSNQTLRMAFL